MKLRPILFSGPMVRALLAGTKTQTRRIMRPAHVGLLLADDQSSGHDLCPYGQPGDLLWVRETWALEDCGDDGLRIIWKADRAAVWVEANGTHIGEFYWLPSDYGPERWRPSIHMPRWASRLTLEVTGVRVDKGMISVDDALAEGFSSPEEFRIAFEALYGAGAIDLWRWAVSFRVLK